MNANNCQYSSELTAKAKALTFDAKVIGSDDKAKTVKFGLEAYA